MNKFIAFTKRRWLWLLLAIGLAIGSAGWHFGWFASKQTVSYKTAKLDRGAITASVSASGTINPVSSVSVGSQVSDRKSTRLNSSHRNTSRMPSSA